MAKKIADLDALNELMPNMNVKYSLAESDGLVFDVDKNAAARAEMVDVLSKRVAQDTEPMGNTKRYVKVSPNPAEPKRPNIDEVDPRKLGWNDSVHLVGMFGGMLPAAGFMVGVQGSYLNKIGVEGESVVAIHQGDVWQNFLMLTENGQNEEEVLAQWKSNVPANFEDARLLSEELFLSRLRTSIESNGGEMVPHPERFFPKNIKTFSSGSYETLLIQEHVALEMERMGYQDSEIGEALSQVFVDSAAPLVFSKKFQQASLVNKWERNSRIYWDNEFGQAVAEWDGESKRLPLTDRIAFIADMGKSGGKGNPHDTGHDPIAHNRPENVPNELQSLQTYAYNRGHRDIDVTAVESVIDSVVRTIGNEENLAKEGAALREIRSNENIAKFRGRSGSLADMMNGVATALLNKGQADAANRLYDKAADLVRLEPLAEVASGQSRYSLIEADRGSQSIVDSLRDMIARVDGPETTRSADSNSASR